MKKIIPSLLFFVSLASFAGGMVSSYNPNSVSIKGGTIDGVAMGYNGGGNYDVNAYLNFLIVHSSSGGDAEFDTPVYLYGAMTGTGSIDGINIGQSIPVNGTFTALGVNGKLFVSPTNPTIASGFGTSPTLTPLNGTALFKLTIGTGGTASSGILNMPTAATGWACFSQPTASNAGNSVENYSGASTQTSVTINAYSLSTGLTAVWAQSITYLLSCFAY